MKNSCMYCGSPNVVAFEPLHLNETVAHDFVNLGIGFVCAICETPSEEIVSDKRAPIGANDLKWKF